MIPDPGTVRMIHDHMIDEELQRQRPMDERDERHATEAYPVQTSRHVLREAIANTVYRIARRIDPQPRAEDAVKTTEWVV